MKKKLPIANCQLPIDFNGRRGRSKIGNCFGFSLLEILVVVTLLSLIVIALMSVFDGTQRAFRASVTQTGVLEGGRAATDLIAADLRAMTPSGGAVSVTGPVNFFVRDNPSYTFLPQPMTASQSGSVRYNLLDYFFALGRDNTKWTAVGYVVNPFSTTSLYPLYRYYAETNAAASPYWLFNQFTNYVYRGLWNSPGLSHVVDGVLSLQVRAYDPNGIWIQNTQPLIYTNALNTFFYPAAAGYDPSFIMYSNTVPAAVDVEIGVLEDRAVAHAEAIPNATARWNYLTNQIGALHLFHRRVEIPNVDPTAYQ